MARRFHPLAQAMEKDTVGVGSGTAVAVIDAPNESEEIPGSAAVWPLLLIEGH